MLVPLRKVPPQLVRLWRAKLRRCCKPPITVMNEYSVVKASSFLSNQTWDGRTARILVTAVESIDWHHYEWK